MYAVATAVRLLRRSRHKLRFAVAAVAFLWIVDAGATAAAAEVVALVPVTPLAGSVAAAGTTENPLSQYAPLITESLRIALTNAGFNVKIVGVPKDFPEIWQESENAGANVVVFGTAAMAEDRLIIQLSAYDAGSRQIISGSIANGRADLSLYNVVDNTVAELASKVLSWVASNPREMLRGQAALVRSISLSSPDDGEQIYLPGGELLGVIKDGSLTTSRLPVPLGSIVMIEKRKPGYITDRQNLRVAKVDEEIRLSGLWPVTHFATDLSWTIGFPLGGGVGVRYFLLPDWLYTAVNLNFSVQTPAFPGGHSVYHLLSYGGLGTYLFWGPTSRFRFSVSAGYGLSTTMFAVPGGGTFYDGYISFLNPAFYANFRRFYGFFRANFWFVVQSSRGLLGDGMVGSNGPPPLTVGVGYKW